jgi:hypothetical protein
MVVGRGGPPPARRPARLTWERQREPATNATPDARREGPPAASRGAHRGSPAVAGEGRDRDRWRVRAPGPRGRRRCVDRLPPGDRDWRGPDRASRGGRVRRRADTRSARAAHDRRPAAAAPRRLPERHPERRLCRRFARRRGCPGRREAGHGPRLRTRPLRGWPRALPGRRARPAEHVSRAPLRRAVHVGQEDRHRRGAHVRPGVARRSLRRVLGPDHPADRRGSPRPHRDLAGGHG